MPRSRELFTLALGLAASNLGYNAAIATLVLYSRDSLHVGPTGFALLFVALSCGGVLAGWFGTNLIRDKPARKVLVVSLVVRAVAWLVVVITANFWATAGALACIGVMATLNSASLTSAEQRLAPQHSLGRVVAVFRMVGVGAGGIGAIAGGFIAQHYGLSAPMIMAAALHCVAGIGVWVLRNWGSAVTTRRAR